MKALNPSQLKIRLCAACDEENLFLSFAYLGVGAKIVATYTKPTSLRCFQMITTGKMPMLFISHGPPFVAVKDCSAHRFLKELGRNLPRARAIISISAHWESVFPLITGSETPGILYDWRAACIAEFAV